MVYNAAVIFSHDVYDHILKQFDIGYGWTLLYINLITYSFTDPLTGLFKPCIEVVSSLAVSHNVKYDNDN